MLSRAQEFEQIRDALRSHLALSEPNALVVQGDSLKLLSDLPDKCVSLIVTDPPYHSTKKANIHGDRSFEEDEHFLEWMRQYAPEWKRVLKLSGTIYMFCSSEMAARLEVMMAEYFRPLNHVVWTKPNEPGYDGWKGKTKKESLRRWYPHSERILVFEHGEYGTREAYRRSPMGQYLLDCRRSAGLTMVGLTEAIGEYGNINRGGAVANWEAGRNIPSREQYGKLVAVLEGTGRIDPMLPYEDLVRPMRLSGEFEFTDVWNFMSVRPFAGKHPAEKPQDMLRHIIAASSYPDDVVLDCFSGSGSTGVAGIASGRRVVCIELQHEWVSRSVDEISYAHMQTPGDYVPPPRQHHMKGRRRDTSELVADRLFE